ncbi:hypothetical protein HOF65_03635 [bacterium]|jgi:hypothetical protein|nr:hypothetical protein [bacterium]MBT3853070.1 hypothetical protein [bacterium]MBT4633329.1 hypothetical protein [bacterium]MBT5492162.1 hypothetical protein [bacterium]MBT6779251.1 hypothetical protein [bacterium]
MYTVLLNILKSSDVLTMSLLMVVVDILSSIAAEVSKNNRGSTVCFLSSSIHIPSSLIL